MEATEIKKHKKVHLSYNDYIQVFFKRLCLPVFKNRWYNLLSCRDEQLLKLCEIAETKIEKDLNVVKIIKHLRELRVLMMNDKLDNAI